MKQVTINLYSFAELGEKEQQKAIESHTDFMERTRMESEETDEFTRDYVIENIEMNEYLFYQDGTLAHCTTYTGKHAKAGLTEFQIHGEVFPLN